MTAALPLLWVVHIGLAPFSLFALLSCEKVNVEIGSAFNMGANWPRLLWALIAERVAGAWSQFDFNEEKARGNKTITETHSDRRSKSR